MPTTYAIPDGRVAMAATTYTGNSSTQSISNAVNGVSFQPDLVWIKVRNLVTGHLLEDSVRGAGLVIRSNETTAEAGTGTYGNTVTSFNSNGFTLGNDTAIPNGVNGTGYNYVAWNWKANGAAVTNTAGSITSQVSANTAAGFSVVTWTGNGTNGATVGHGLGVAPKMVIVKRRSAIENWGVYHASLPSAAYYLVLNTTVVQDSGGATIWNSTAPTSTLLTLGTSTYSNANTSTYVAYCFAPVAGYSAFGSYTGNGSADGPFVYLGFRPRFVITKSYDATAGAGDWTIHDTSRSSYNTADLRLFANASDAESTSEAMDMNSNGFKIRATNSNCNTSGGGYIYMAFAENPFKYANAR